LYQNTDKQFVILHSLDGYDEVSLTGAFKYFYNGGEKVLEPKDLQLPHLAYEDIRGGTTVEESASVFMRILEGEGTPAQQAAVVANAGMALYAADQDAGLVLAMSRAREALVNGKALSAFKSLMEMN
jgi:anthranilate phosphoribosyltransferase